MIMLHGGNNAETVTFRRLASGRFFHYLEDRQEQAHEDGDDCHDDKKLDESKGARGGRRQEYRFHCAIIRKPAAQMLPRGYDSMIFLLPGAATVIDSAFPKLARKIRNQRRSRLSPEV